MRTQIHRNSAVAHWSGVGIIAVAVAAVWRAVLFAPSAIVSGDLYVPFRWSAIAAQLTSFWNPVLEFPNVETIDRLAFAAPFLALGEPAAIQRAMIAAVLLGAGTSLYASARRLGAPWLLAVLGGIAYACNPWVAVRLQHLYLLPGYAVLPAVVALWIRPPRRYATAWLVLLLTLGSTTPHSTAALWGVLVVFFAIRPTRASARRLAWTAGAYGLVNLWWLVPVAAFVSATDLVPSWPTIEQIELFSRNADLVSVMRLDGYWWPATNPLMSSAVRVAGLGLAAAAVLGLITRSRERLALAVLAAACGVLALGTQGVPLFALLTVEGPVADRLGWLLRDPNKLVGPLAAFLLLLATGAAANRRAWISGASAALLSAYLVFGTTYVARYLPAAYAAHPVPEGLQQAAAWLADRSGRTAWVPAYFGGQTFWNGDQLTPEFLSNSSPLPALSPYAYDPRATAAFLTLDFGAILGDVVAEPETLMSRWGIDWLVHHRDVRPARLQAPGAIDPRVELRSIRLTDHALPVAEEFRGVTVYGVDVPARAREVVPLLTNRPIAAAAALSAFGEHAIGRAGTDQAHEAIRHVLLLPGDAAEVTMASEWAKVPLAAAAPRSAPRLRWSRVGEGELAWWPFVAARGGPAPSDAGAVVTTSAPGATLGAEMAVPTGVYHVWVRAYTGPRSGRVRVETSHLHGAAEWTLDLRDQQEMMTWLDLGAIEAGADELDFHITNLEGDNVIADLRLISDESAAAAEDDLERLEPSWLWTRTSACTRPATTGESVDLDVDAQLPVDIPLDGDTTWSSFPRIEMEILGDGQERTVEAWTNADGRWIFLGDLRVAWSGWRSADVAVMQDAFSVARRGARTEARLIRLLEPRHEEDGAHVGEAEPLRVRGVRLVATAACIWELSAPQAGERLLWTSGGAEPFPIVLGDRRFLVQADAPVQVELEKGLNIVEFPEGVPRSLQAIWLGPESMAPGREPSIACATTWRLVWTPDRYVDGMFGIAGGHQVEATPVDGLMAGFWLPAGACGTVEPWNPWRRIGTLSLIASLAATLALAVGSVMRKIP